jgi:hypothetical protein
VELCNQHSLVFAPLPFHHSWEFISNLSGGDCQISIISVISMVVISFKYPVCVPTNAVFLNIIHCPVSV